MQRAAILGGGVIGGGWLARLIENGIDVVLCDPDPAAEGKLAQTLENADRAYAKLTVAPRGGRGNWRLTRDMADAVADAELVIEAVPERLELKRAVYAEAERAAPQDALITSSTSGFRPTELQSGMRHPGRLLVAHPFVPVYLLPLVELVAGEQTDPAAMERAEAFFPAIGMKPVRLKKEIDAFLADRFMEAVWREALWLVKDGIGTTEDIDDSIRFGFGLRWAQMGLFETFRLGGGAGGMRHFLHQFAPALAWPWTRLTDVPEMDEALVDLVASQSDAQSGAYSIGELERIRDDNLIAIMQALKANDWGAGRVLADYEKRLFDRVTTTAPADLSKPIRTLERQVPPDWTDYNNHMNEARYLQCFADATDAFMRLIGCDAEYIAKGGSYFTVETHIRHLDEVAALEPIHATTQVMEGTGGKRMRLFHRLFHEDGRLLATGEHMLLHVSLATRRASDPAPEILARLDEIAALHAKLETPEGAGRAVGQPR